MKDLKGTKTERNLQEAFAGESQARNKYSYYASKAKKDGYEQMNCTPKVRQKTFGVQFVYEKNIHREAQHSKPSPLWGAPETIVRTVSSWAALFGKFDRPLSQIR